MIGQYMCHIAYVWLLASYTEAFRKPSATASSGESAQWLRMEAVVLRTSIGRQGHINRLYKLEGHKSGTRFGSAG